MSILRYTIEDLQEYAASRGGKCLSRKYETLTKQYKWECGEGHTWFATAQSTMKNGHWCPECAGHGGHRHCFHVHEEAAQWGGKVLSTRYSSKKLQFSCMHGHIFENKPSKLMNGAGYCWCPECRRLVRQASIAWTAAKIADDHGGRLLTTADEFHTLRDSAEFECAHGHRFRLRIDSLKRGVWCAACWQERRRKKAGKDKN